jgi:fructosamine-3-kinase
VKLTPNQLFRIGQLSDQWSFLWDKQRLLWIAAEDCPDGAQVEEPDLEVLLAQLQVILRQTAVNPADCHGHTAIRGSAGDGMND